jgi:hypothetical protein
VAVTSQVTSQAAKTKRCPEMEADVVDTHMNKESKEIWKQPAVQEREKIDNKKVIYRAD